MRIRFCLNGSVAFTISRPIALLPTNIVKSIALNIDKPEEYVKPVEGRPLIFKVVKEGIVLRPFVRHTSGTLCSILGC